MLSFYKKYYKTVFDIALIGLTIYLFMLLFSYLYKLATPIFLALLIFAMIEPLAKRLNRRGVKKSIATAISMLVFMLVVLGILIGAGIIFTSQTINLVDKIPRYQQILQEQIVIHADYLRSKWEALPPDISDKVREYIGVITEWGAGAATTFLKTVLNSLTSLTSFIINFSIGIILAYFLSIEIELWKRMARDKTPRTFKTAFYFLKENVLLGIVSYLKSQFKLVSITFVIIFLALLLLGVKSAFSISLLAAVFDVLPLLGVSTVFIPWIIYLFIVGETTLAIWLTVLLGVVIIVRQIMEPKITGDSLGVSAFTMLSFMIISLSLFGVAGLILSPILIILLKALHEQGYLKQWIRLPEDYDNPPAGDTKNEP
ncbi:sporulation integral membrane protein YtvI [Paenibacillus contaminans]|uniref:Sporulation integral membrane protein YtvI n=1 Tax=Paenibacillus contaminans TaxID=450362 RepID=A0A329MH66_9BACL|nr:sporulation integral membrane protein YtvI [Paenibacillus contaminans]RAV19032.1 sporulation integral membrane protein YtvI [Paenibacillus contaminans]